MTEYLLLFRGGDAARMDAQQSPEQWQQHMQKWMQWMDGLAKEGKLVGAQPLKADGMFVKGKDKILMNGPFIEGKEIVGGYLICKVHSMEEAIDVSKGCPILEHDGIVEIREINELTMQ